ncbi:unnamed protein product [Kuraishia capsulata CBS 1993]|uniref:ABC1 atypical kinase-like domain-containing protein n=1 Tax=Kuraishia capsulata CBS 1993 TaxID=1382522 RepID=W6ML35_9ASCO|nr:uncharacterized protein KUCA_T00002777001 [Kuraishia capsulata CBS 1993]CDK26803.1 unnamed protein product [Kuraishia capsulata CBS 1993]
MIKGVRFGTLGFSTERVAFCGSRGFSRQQPERPRVERAGFGTRFFSYAFLGLTGVYFADNKFNNSVITRATRSVTTLLLISADYKWNFEEGKDIEALHQRNSKRLYDMIASNKGLYVKIGQMIAIQGSMFPMAYQEKFKRLFDNAPADSWATVDSVLSAELGRDYRTKHFEWIDEAPVASASIAQVHKAVLKNGEKVAVKVQHKSLEHQVPVDLAIYQQVMDFYSWFFEMQISFVTQYICDTMKEETDFNIEYRNGALLKSKIDSDPEFRNRMYVPKVYPDLVTKKVLVAEWIEGDSVSEMKRLKVKGYNIAELSKDIVKLYARQAFEWGDVHSDPHPGNFIVRMVKDGNKTRQQLVILDHGLYVHLSDKFRREYCQLFKALSEADTATMKQLTTEWGIRQGDMFTSMATMSTEGMKDMKKRFEEMRTKSDYEKQVMMKEQMKNFFDSTDKFPLAMVFLGRGMRIVQGINHQLGAPVNRLAILSDEARRSLRLSPLVPTLAKSSILSRTFAQSVYRYAIFCTFRVVLTLAYWTYRIRSNVYAFFAPHSKGAGEDIEEVIDKQMVYAAQTMGMQVKTGDYAYLG